MLNSSINTTDIITSEIDTCHEEITVNHNKSLRLSYSHDDDDMNQFINVNSNYSNAIISFPSEEFTYAKFNDFDNGFGMENILYKHNHIDRYNNINEYTNIENVIDDNNNNKNIYTNHIDSINDNIIDDIIDIDKSNVEARARVRAQIHSLRLNKEKIIKILEQGIENNNNSINVNDNNNQSISLISQPKSNIKQQYEVYNSNSKEYSIEYDIRFGSNNNNTITNNNKDFIMSPSHINITTSNNTTINTIPKTNISSTIFQICPNINEWYNITILLTHEPIRIHLNDIINIIKSNDFIGYPWQIQAFFRWFIGDKNILGYYDMIKYHHHTEDTIYFPFLQANGRLRSHLSAKLAVDHILINKLMNNIKNMYNNKILLNNIEDNKEFISLLIKNLEELQYILFKHLEKKELNIPIILSNYCSEEEDDEQKTKIRQLLKSNGPPMTAFIYDGMLKWATLDIREKFLNKKLPWLKKQLLLNFWLPKFQKIQIQLRNDMKSLTPPK